MRMNLRVASGFAWLCLLAAGIGSARAALLPGEYACAGSGGRILLGLGFKLAGDGSYMDLDGKNPGRVTYGAGGSTVTFVGGHLDGQTGRNVRNGGKNFEINTISCSRN